MSYSVVCIMSEGSCGHWGCCAIHFGAHHPTRFLWSLGICALHFGAHHTRRFLWSLGMLCHIFWCASYQKVLVATGDVVPYILVCNIPEGSCGLWGCCGIHSGAHLPRRFLCSLGMLCYTFWCASSQKVLVVTGDLCLTFWCTSYQKVLVTGDVMLYILVRIITEGSCGHWGSCAIHFGVHHPRRFLCSLGMCFCIVWCIVFDPLVLTFRDVRSLAVCCCMLTVCVLQICVLMLQSTGMCCIALW